MAYWLIVTILAYLFFGLASLGDKLVLTGKPKAISYTFYVGIFSIFVILFIPFTKFAWLGGYTLMWVALDALVHVLGLYTMFLALEKFDVSKVIPTIGATQPMFVFILIWIFLDPQELPMMDLIAFIILLLGTIVISLEKNIEVTGNYLKFTILSALMFSLDYVFSKFVFLDQPFLTGIIWIRMFVFLFVLLFLFKKSARDEIFSKKIVYDARTQTVFLYAQICGGAANFLQSFAISLAPVAFLAIVNSLRGIQYIFLFIIALFLSFAFPRVFKEELSKRIFVQKIASIILIAIGLAILVSY